MKLNTIELFAGTKSFSKVMAAHGHDTLTIDNDPALFPDIMGDILGLKDFGRGYLHDFLWASPPCQGFSVCVIGRNWNRDYTPKSDRARQAMLMLQKTISLIEDIKPRYWFIENPRGMLRKMPFIEEFLVRAGGGPLYGLVLSIWGHTPEAHGHMDQCDVVASPSDLQARMILS